jgi:hypothetical protein
MIKKMDEIRERFSHQKIQSQETLKRHKEIETRLLEFEKAQREQEEDEKRQSKSTTRNTTKITAKSGRIPAKTQGCVGAIIKQVPPEFKAFL